MPKQNSIQLFQKAKKELASPEKQKPVYFFCGEEDFFLSRLQKTVEELVPPEQKDFNFDLVYARDKSPEQVLNIARSFPMMADQRIVIVRDFLSLNIDSYNKTGSGGGLELFLPYFKNPNPATLLVLIDDKKPNGRTRLGRTIKRSDHISLYEFKEVKDYLLIDWVVDWTKTYHQKQIDAQAAQLIVQMAGNNLQLLSTEIDKVCTFVDTLRRVNIEDVKKIIGSYREYSVFELKDALFAGDLDHCLSIVERMLHHSTSNAGEVIRSVGFFHNVFSNIWQIRRLAAKGNSKGQVQEALGIRNQWYFNKLWEDASHFSLDDMPRIFEALLDADSAAKGFSTLDPQTILLLMLKRIIN